MALAPDSLIDMARVYVARAATAKSCRRHEANFSLAELPRLEDLIPSSLSAPEMIDPIRNGYVLATKIAEAMPSASPTESNAVHRALSLVGSECPNEMAASRSALCVYEESIEELIDVLDADLVWQVPTPTEDADLPELTNFKRLGQALLLKAVIQVCAKDEAGAEKDIAHVLDLSKRMRNCQGFMLHLLVGVSIEVIVHKILRQMLRKPETREFSLRCLERVTLEGRKSELIETYRQEFARVCIPRALFYVRPWKPVPAGSPASFEFPNLAAQYALTDHPAPYDPVETALELASIGEVLLVWIEEGWSTAPAIEEMRQNFAKGWPDGVTVSPFARRHISLRSLTRARKALLDVDNPFGKLGCARTLHSAYEVYRATLLGQLRIGATLVFAASCRLGHQASCLEELVGNGHLNAIPVDPFTDAPMGYDRTDGAVWSPGPAGLTYAEARKCGCSRYDSPYWLKVQG
jgi:hypothetical protein